MYSMSNEQAPYITLGQHLKYVREQSNESLIEVSGAVEIETEVLERIEAGIERPAEDILLLLISHFNVADREALQLWELAAYDTETPEQLRPDNIEQQLQGKQIVMLVGMDNRSIYSDGLDVIWNRAGVTLNFTQAAGQSQVVPVAKVGMSYEQAHNVMRTLEQALLRAKYLPPNHLLSSGESDPTVKS